MDGDHSIHRLFLPREYAVILPLTAGTFLLIGIGLFPQLFVLLYTSVGHTFILGVFVAVVTISNRKSSLPAKKES